MRAAAHAHAHAKTHTQTYFDRKDDAVATPPKKKEPRPEIHPSTHATSSVWQLRFLRAKLRDKHMQTLLKVSLLVFSAGSALRLKYLTSTSVEVMETSAQLLLKFCYLTQTMFSSMYSSKLRLWLFLQRSCDIIQWRDSPSQRAWCWLLLIFFNLVRRPIWKVNAALNVLKNSKSIARFLV